MTHTVTAFKNELRNQPAVALENYFGVSENFFSDYAVLFGTGGAKARVSWGFKLSLEKVVCQWCISADCSNTVLGKGMASAWKQASEGGRNTGLLFWE